MKKTFYLIIVILSLVGFTNTHAQEPINIGTTFKIHATKLKEDRTIQVYLPTSYLDTSISKQSYPVIYLLDGESNFNYLSAYVEKLSKGPYPSIPEAIIIGIPNTNRTRDLTPTKPIQMTTEQSQKIKGEMGGNINFFSFIEDDLLPYITTTYRTNGYNILIGHSFGGITALNYMLKDNNHFKSFIVHDPSIWWDDQYILREYQATLQKDFKNKKLFLTQVGESENKDHLSAHYSGIQSFNSLLQNNNYKGLTYKYQQYEGEDHGSIPLKGNLDGLRYIFDDFKINFKDIVKQPTLIQDTYQKLSKELGHPFTPNEAYLKTIINYFIKNKETEQIAPLIEYTKSIYPTFKINNN
ncbi:MAG: alpha/beta hydrolase [Flavobacteriaceae bacterium]|jgi:predicted alpha/beta superfamily hydrolase|nr:alpha/beta hydrolase [Flavobacteriaceae bacterium]